MGFLGPTGTPACVFGRWLGLVGSTVLVAASTGPQTPNINRPALNRYPQLAPTLRTHQRPPVTTPAARRAYSYLEFQNTLPATCYIPHPAHAAPWPRRRPRRTTTTCVASRAPRRPQRPPHPSASPREPPASGTAMAPSAPMPPPPPTTLPSPSRPPTPRSSSWSATAAAARRAC